MKKLILFVFFLPILVVAQIDTVTIPVDSVSEVQKIVNDIPETINIGMADSAVVASEKKKDTLSIIGVGDIMLGTAYPSRQYLPRNEDCLPLMADVKYLLKDADVTFGNMEGAITNSHKGAKVCKNPDQCYVFAMPEKFISCFVDAGFNLINIANNHSGDFNYQGRNKTAHLLDSVKINWAGTTLKPYVIFEKDGITYGLASFSPNWETPQITDIAGAKRTVAHLDSLCDVVIVSFHGGAEGSKSEHVTKATEVFFGENRGDVYKFSHAVVDAGADIVFGHGPHVTRAVELYKDRFIAYSLGNFCTYERFNLSGPNGYAPLVKVYVDNKGKFLNGKIYPIVQVDGVGTKLDSQNRVITRMQQLTATDFPNSLLMIENNGVIIRNK